MTELAAILKRRIAATGPITLADYMAECLLNPAHGYYATRDPLGAKGDFTTAPEISQMFGELIGLSLAQSWLDQGAPEGLLVEAGPGRGTLMADIWRATKGVPGFHQRMRIVLVEASPVLRGVQAERLTGAPVEWLDHLDQLPEAPVWFVANEFFDALPIRQFQRDGAGWREVVVGLEGEALKPGLSPRAVLAELEHRLADTHDGDLVELCPAARPAMEAVAGRIARHGGAAIIVDYGDWRSKGDTFQAMEDHAFADPFAHPGRADLTAHVDFEGLARYAAPLTASGLTPQGLLLQALGIEGRASRLAQSMHGEALRQHLAAFRRLTDAQEMGTLFKALALAQAGAPLPPGFFPAQAHEAAG
ncbi:class I SAM-dependent methyltransferase [Pararhodobacter sp. CCB-MM2]|uniref:class I SAM-dependent methyltransferase n=1 Tax=Pararhodobacter sp. CCB-MM2 TaxID=1786003 RepID=UPI0008307444|nr:SAM-dependent methyltransferase [Pararhodobacter sp. CCB-MM2]